MGRSLVFIDECLEGVSVDCALLRITTLVKFVSAIGFDWVACATQEYGLLQQLPTLHLELLLCRYFLVTINLSVGVYRMNLRSCCATQGRRLGEVGRFRQLYRLVLLASKKKTCRSKYDQCNGNKNEGLTQRPVAPDSDYHGLQTSVKFEWLQAPQVRVLCKRAMKATTA